MAGHVLVVGGARGIGRALVEMLAARECAVSVIGRRCPSQMDIDHPNVYCRAVDLLDARRVARVLKEIIRRRGKLTGLVFFQRYRGAADDWENEWNLSLTATKKIVEALSGSFENTGSIVMVSSINAHLIAPNLPLSYHVAKAGLLQMVRYYAVRLGPKGIRVNSVSPGTVLKKESKDFYLRDKSWVNLYKKIAPLGRMGTADEVARVVAFLCGPNSSFITGQDLIVDGGVSLQWQESLARGLTIR